MTRRTLIASLPVAVLPSLARAEASADDRQLSALIAEYRAAFGSAAGRLEAIAALARALAVAHDIGDIDEAEAEADAAVARLERIAERACERIAARA